MRKKTPRGTVEYLPILTEEVVEEFWSRVRIVRHDGCWVWRGNGRRNLSYKYYAAMYVDGRQYLAHRMAWTIANQREPGKGVVCHSCDNPICVNPEHLWLGTDGDNVRDHYRKKAARPELLPVVKEMAA